MGNWTSAHQRLWVRMEAADPVTAAGEAALRRRERQGRRWELRDRVRQLDRQLTNLAIRERVAEQGRQRRQEEAQRRDPWGWTNLFDGR